MKKGFEIMRATRKRAWLEDLMQIVERQGGATFEVMGQMLELVAVCRVILVTVIALITALRTESKLPGDTSLCPEFGYFSSEADQFVAANGFDEVYHIFFVDTLTGCCREVEGGGSREERRSPRRR